MKTESLSDTHLTLDDVAETYQVSKSTLRRDVKSGALGHHRIGAKGLIRVSPKQLNDWVETRSGTSETKAKRADIDVAPAGANDKISVKTGNVGVNLNFTILNADVTVGLRHLPPSSVNSIVTSPPYFWQRDYNVAGQIGHEKTIAAYVDALVSTFSDARRVLADDGVLFLNLGDGYYNAKGKPHGKDAKHGARMIARQTLRAVDGPGLGLPRKSLIGLPWRVALGLQADGWTLRSSVIWHRPRTLGEATSHDRPWRTYENIFIFSKAPKYFFDRSGLGDEEDIWTIAARPENPYAHCAPFPLALVEKCLRVGCKPGGIVLDPFLGSGTTAIAALKSNRSAIGIELNSDTCNLAQRRIVEAFEERLAGPKRKA